MSKGSFGVMLRILGVLFVAFSFSGLALAQQQDDSKPALNPLVRVLQSKGILTAEEVAQISQAPSASLADQRLAQLLLSKGVISQADYDQTVGASVVLVSQPSASSARVVPAVLRTTVPARNSTLDASLPGAQDKPAAAPAVIPALAPIRVFPVDPAKREGFAPDLKLGPVRLKPYGFIKASAVYDHSSPGGNDFPLPGFLGDSGPDGSPEFHIKARGLRLGANFEWLDPSPKLTVTGKFEYDFEGNFTRVNNRNISTIRSSMASIRLAFMRLDYKAGDQDGVFALFGQDWTPFGSSTLPSLFETTGLGVGFGTLYERAPQFRFGWNHDFGGSAKFKIQPEIAIVLPAYGNVPSLVDNELAFGERQGVDSARPELEGRIVAQFQLDKAPGVAPAQIIGSFVDGKRTAIVTAATVPGAFKSAFPRGATVDSDRKGVSGEIQLPTRYATLIAKYYTGSDLRFFFVGQLFSNFNDTNGLFQGTTGECFPVSSTNPASSGSSIDGSATVLFAFSNPTCTTATVAPQRPVRTSGGFVNLGLPLSRIFGADPQGRNMGWSLYLHYAVDFAKARDVRRFASTAAGSRWKSDVAAATLNYKLNNWVTFSVEESLYRTYALRGTNAAGVAFGLPLYRGTPTRLWPDFRSEVGTTITF
jgi:hypothetical protein